MVHGSQQKGAESQLRGTGSVIRGSGSQIRGDGSEIRRDPPNLTPGANETAEQHLQLLRSATFVSFSKLYYAQFEVVSHKIFWRGCFARLAPPAAPEGKLPRSLSYAIGLRVIRGNRYGFASSE